MAQYPEIRDLQMLIALSQRKHFTQAAADCGISQPAFSARIRQLEEELGVPIVRRGNKFLGFTKDGERVLMWASKILTNAEGLRQDMEISKGALRGVLVLGVVPTALTYAANVSTELRKIYPKLSIQIRSLTSSLIARGIQEYSLDAGITYRDDVNNSTLRFDPIYDEQYVLLAPAHLAPRLTGYVTWAEAANLPLCLLSKDMHFRRIVDSVFRKAGIVAEPAMETNAITAALAQVSTGSAATIAPSSLVDSLLLGADTVSLTLNEPSLSHEIGLSTLNNDSNIPALAALRDVVLPPL